MEHTDRHILFDSRARLERSMRDRLRSILNNQLLFLPAIAIGLYEIYDSFYVRLAPYEKEFYAVALVAAAVGAAFGLARQRLSASALAWLLALAVAGLLPLYPLADVDLADHRKLAWAFADIGVLLLPVLLFLWLHAFRDDRQALRAVALAAGLHGIAAVLAPLAGTGVLTPPGAAEDLADKVIYDAASPLLLTALWAWLLTRPSRKDQILVGVCIVAATIQVVFSQDRSTVIASILIPCLAGVLDIRRLRQAGFAITLVCCVMVVGLANAVGVSTSMQSLLGVAAPASSTVDERESDQSLQRRIAEMSDILMAWSTNYRLTDSVTGRGYGATFKPRESSVNTRNFDDHGRVHHIHNTYMALLYRNGFPVLILIGAGFAILTISYARAVLEQEKGSTVFQIMSIVGIIYLPFGVMNNIMVQPTVSLALAYGLWFAVRSPARPSGQRACDRESPRR